MPRVYQWTDEDDEVAFDAVTVGIGGAAAAFAAVGLVYGEINASVMWPEMISQGDRVLGGMDGPFDVPTALHYADQTADLYGFRRVVISIQDRGLWDNAWGTLAEEPGIALPPAKEDD